MTRPEVITWQSTNAETVQSSASSLAQSPQRSQTDSRKHGASIKSAESISGQDLSTDASDAMLHSALIVHNYRLLNSTETMAQSSQNFSSSQQHSAIDSASCLVPAMCDSNSVESDVFEDQGKMLKRSKCNFELHSMLCNTPPVIIDEIKERYHDHTILEQCRRIPNNIVLDSLCPDVAPHIVITPADEQWDVGEIMQNNHAGPQCRPHLTVPPFFGLTCRMHTYEEFVSMFYQPAYQPHPPQQGFFDEAQHIECTDTWSDALESQPQPSQSQSPRMRQFEALPQEADWACFINDLTRILIFQARKLIAIETSLRANAFRTRYDTPGFLESVQPPHEWIDPAKAIFSDYSHRCPRSSILIESDVPFTAPHIIIHLAPPNDPTLISAYPTKAQDEGLLTVPLHYEHGRNSYGYELESETPYEDEQSYFDYLSDTSSDVDPLSPRTPSDLQRVGSGFFSGFSDEIEEDITSAHRGYKEYRIVSQSETYPLASHEEHDTMEYFQIYTDKTPSKFFISSNDDYCDSESLPDMETDEWFIQNRARSATATTFDF